MDGVIVVIGGGTRGRVEDPDDDFSGGSHGSDHVGDQGGGRVVNFSNEILPPGIQSHLAVMTLIL